LLLRAAERKPDVSPICLIPPHETGGFDRHLEGTPLDSKLLRGRAGASLCPRPASGSPPWPAPNRLCWVRVCPGGQPYSFRRDGSVRLAHPLSSDANAAAWGVPWVPSSRTVIARLIGKDPQSPWPCAVAGRYAHSQQHIALSCSPPHRRHHLHFLTVTTTIRSSPGPRE
jgi:lambda repressor-like predicted transcriptional regulator